MSAESINPLPISSATNGNYVIAVGTTQQDLLNDLSCWLSGVKDAVLLAAMELGDKSSEMHANPSQAAGILFNAHYLADMASEAAKAALSIQVNKGGASHE